MIRLKVINQYEGSFTLAPEAQATLFDLLTREPFIEQIGKQVKCDRVEFTELLFQPVPYAPGSTKGMPVEYEQYHDSPDYAIINVPPNFMFQSKIFQPSRLCAIYKKFYGLS